jgi:cell division protein FtsQ
LVLLGAIAAGYLFWLRDSSLVAVTEVEVAGVRSGERAEIVAELTRTGEQMTTLHVERERIERAASAFPTVESVDVATDFPHGLRIEVNERPPRLVVRSGDEQVAVAADGVVLAGVAVPEGELPVLELDQVPSGGSLGGEPLEQALVLGSVPEPLRPLIEGIDYSDDYGVEVTLRGEIPVRFGSGSRAAEKWAAAAAVLADPELGGLTYLDVRVPARPAHGGGTSTVLPADPQA